MTTKITQNPTNRTITHKHNLQKKKAKATVGSKKGSTNHNQLQKQKQDTKIFNNLPSLLLNCVFSSPPSIIFVISSLLKVHFALSFCRSGTQVPSASAMFTTISCVRRQCLHQSADFTTISCEEWDGLCRSAFFFFTTIEEWERSYQSTDLGQSTYFFFLFYMYRMNEHVDRRLRHSTFYDDQLSNRFW